jgi:23S rRNA (uracil1939-C5)-methyltransferase
VQIEAVDDEGRGRGIFTDHDGHEFDIAVRGAFVGDDVMAMPERTFPSRKLITSKALHFFEQGPCHTERTCTHPTPCPTCPLHGATQSLALEIKRARIERALSDVALDFPIEDVVPHPSEFGYRQKVKLMAQVEDGQLRLGVYVPYSHDFVIAEQCPYVHPAINHSIDKLLALVNSEVKVSDLHDLKAVILRAGRDGVAAVVVTKRPFSSSLFSQLETAVQQNILLSVVERVHEENSNSILAGERGRSVGPSLIKSLEGGPLVDPDSFCQSDPVQATFMYDLIAQFLVEDDPEACFVDAYAGVGGFTRALQRAGARNIVSIELSPNALVSLNELGTEVILASMSDALSSLQDREISGMVVDPPKKGLMGDAKAIAELGAKRVALVSCDPDAMAKDLRVFLNHGYVVQRIVPIDLFGGTPAVETIVLLKLSGNSVTIG